MTTNSLGWLPHLGLVRFSGPDAGQFLQGQVSNDTRRLSAGAPVLAAYSTPQGRVVALLQLVPHSGGIIALLPREMVASTVARLRKYVLRAKVQMEDLDGHYSVLGLHGTDQTTTMATPGAGEAYREHEGIGVCRVRAGIERFWVIGETQRLSDLVGGEPAAQERFELGWRLANIRAGMPQVYARLQELFVAQMLNLDLIDGISFTKGCFTGQEIIARTQHLGRIKRRLFRLRLPPGAWEIGQLIQLADGRSGRLTDVAATDDGVEALAVLTLEPGIDAEQAAAPKVAAVELPLPYQLTAPA